MKFKNILCTIVAFVLICLSTNILSACVNHSAIIMNENQKPEMTVGNVFYVDCPSGKLKCTITDAYMLSQNPGCLSIDKFMDHSFVVSGGKTYKWPEYIREDGVIVDGCDLVLVDLSVEGEDAENDFYSDPHIFRADSIIGLINLAEKKGTNYKIKPVDYYSGINVESEHPLAFRLEGNSIISFTIGFLIDENWASNPSLLCASTGASTDSTIINLHLGK